MSHPNILAVSNCLLVVVDMQDSLLRFIHESEKVAANTIKLVEAAKVLDVPVLTTVQYRQKLGVTTQAIADILPVGTLEIDKTSFSCLGSEAFNEALSRYKKKQVMLAGIETHVCISQTAHDLLNSEYSVHVACDAVSSRTSENRAVGLQKMASSGCIITSTEMAIFEMIKDSTSPLFKRILPLIK